MKYNELKTSLLTKDEVRVGSIEEAIDLCLKLKDEEVFDLFRGQRDSSWEVVSTAERLSSEKEKEKMQTELAWFFGYIEETQELAHLKDEQGAPMAIAQHYGLATPFIDFTSNPITAAFFSSDGLTEEDLPLDGVIFCLKSEDVENQRETIESVLDRERVSPQIIKLTVGNLWRLEAQEGCFLWVPLGAGGVSGFYRLHKVCFPHKLPQSSAIPQARDIYPDNQSPLEILLSEFFMQRRLHYGSSNHKLFMDKELSEAFHIELPRETADWTDSLPEAKDWNDRESWKFSKIESYNDASPFFLINPQTTSLEEFASCLMDAFTNAFIKENRSSGIRISTDGILSTSAQANLSRSLIRQWNGMRNLPYTDEEICLSLHTTIKVYLHYEYGDRDETFYLSPDEEKTHVEIGKKDSGSGAYSRAIISVASLASCFTDQYLEALRDNTGFLPLEIARLSHRYQCSVKKRYSFNSLRKLMVEELIPSQMFARGEDNGQKDHEWWIAFSPLEIGVLASA